MAANTSLMDFHVDSSITADHEQIDGLLVKVQTVLQTYGFEIVHRSPTNVQNGSAAFFLGPRSSSATLRYYIKGLLTVTIEEYVYSEETAEVTDEKTLSEIEQKIRKEIGSTQTKRFPSIKRGGELDPYETTSDNRLIQYDFDKVVYSARSPYQDIKIFHSISFGNILVLDELQNLAESDLIYTQTLMRYGELNYAGKTVLILGGGDGALLYELLKEKPSFVIMIEIDAMVIEACRKHLRSVSGDCLDRYESENYKIIVDDCLKVMENFVRENKVFDFVIGDLTDIPITPTPQGEIWNFHRKILDLSFRIIGPTGRFLTHGNGVGSKRALEMYEEQLQNLHCPVEYRRHTAYVPSFLECWVFYEVWKKSSESHANGKAACIV